ncbi:hypothetical protein [Streptomyces sp. NPDC001100]
MAQHVLALGAALVTASGCVWYLPALADLRAGTDRPVSRRTAAAACLAGWTTLACIAVLLFVGVIWQTACVVATAGATVTAALRIRAAAQHHHEVREIVRHWAALDADLPQHGRRQDLARYVVAALLACGPVSAVVTAAIAVTTASGTGGIWTLAATPAVVGLALATAITYTRSVRRRTTAARTRPLQ